MLHCSRYVLSIPRSVRLLVSKAYRLKLYPNVAQREAFLRWTGSCRWLWNMFLQMEQEEYKKTGKFIFRYDLDKLIPGLKKDYPWLGETPYCCLQRVARHIDVALKRKFQAGAGFPRFKNRAGRRSCYLTNDKFRLDGTTHVVLPKAGRMRFRAGRIPEGKVMGGTIRLIGDAWYLVLQCKVEILDVTVAPDAETVLGGDLGLSKTAVLSDGTITRIANVLKRKERKVKREQRKMARQVKGSKNREKTRRRLAKAKAAETNARNDFRHKLSRAIVDKASVIVLEDLLVMAMAMALNFGRAVNEAGLAEIRRQVEYKAMWDGKTVVIADRFFPSTQKCSACGHVKTGSDKLKLSDRTYRCGACGHTADRDLNAAMNLRRYGLEALSLVKAETDNASGEGYSLELRQGDNACGGYVRREGESRSATAAETGIVACSQTVTTNQYE